MNPPPPPHTHDMVSGKGSKVSIHLSIVLSPKPLDPIQPNLLSGLYKWVVQERIYFCTPDWGGGGGVKSISLPSYIYELMLCYMYLLKRLDKFQPNLLGDLLNTSGHARADVFTFASNPRGPGEGLIEHHWIESNQTC